MEHIFLTDKQYTHWFSKCKRKIKLKSSYYVVLSNFYTPFQIMTVWNHQMLTLFT